MSAKKKTRVELEKIYGKFKPALSLLEKKFGRFTFGDFVKMGRVEMELTQVEMAKKLGIAAGTLCDIEKGRQRVSASLAVKIASLADLSEAVAVKLVFEEQLYEAKINFKVELKPA